MATSKGQCVEMTPPTIQQFGPNHIQASMQLVTAVKDSAADWIQTWRSHPPTPGEISFEKLRGGLIAEIICCTVAGWHVDEWTKDKDLLEFEDSTQTFLVLESPNHKVEAGKSQLLPHCQQPGTAFQLDVSKRHRCHGLRKPYDQLWLGLSIRDGVGLREDIEALIELFDWTL